MSGFALHPQAYNDLEEICEYIATDSWDASDRVREEIYDAISELVPFPLQATTAPISRRNRYVSNPYGTM